MQLIPGQVLQLTADNQLQLISSYQATSSLQLTTKRTVQLTTQPISCIAFTAGFETSCRGDPEAEKVAIPPVSPLHTAATLATPCIWQRIGAIDSIEFLLGSNGWYM